MHDGIHCLRYVLQTYYHYREEWIIQKSLYKCFVHEIVLLSIYTICLFVHCFFIIFLHLSTPTKPCTKGKHCTLCTLYISYYNFFKVICILNIKWTFSISYFLLKQLMVNWMLHQLLLYKRIKNSFINKIFFQKTTFILLFNVQ